MRAFRSPAGLKIPCIGLRLPCIVGSRHPSGFGGVRAGGVRHPARIPALVRPISVSAAPVAPPLTPRARAAPHPRSLQILHDFSVKEAQTSEVPAPHVRAQQSGGGVPLSSASSSLGSNRCRLRPGWPRLVGRLFRLSCEALRPPIRFESPSPANSSSPRSIGLRA